MDRLTEIEIDGKVYFLNFSVSAAAQVYEKFGDMTGMQESMTDGFSGESVENTLWMLALLLEQGAAYQAIRNGGKGEMPDMESLPALLSMHEFHVVQGRIFEAVTKSIAPTIEVKPSKNAETTQGNRALRGFGFMGGFSPFRRKP